MVEAAINFKSKLEERGQAMKSNHYKLVNKTSKIIEAQGSAAEMRKLRKKNPDQYVIFLSPGTGIGDRILFSNQKIS